MQAQFIVQVRRVTYILVLFAVLLLGASCSRKNGPATTSVWAILPLTGPGASAGEQAKESILAAFDLHAARSGDASSAPDLDVVFIDSKSAPKDALAAFQQKMALAGRPLAIISQMSSVSAALAPLVKEARVPILSIGSTEAPTEGNPYFFVDYIPAVQQAQLYNGFLGDARAISFFYLNDEYGKSVAAAMRRQREVDADTYIAIEASVAPRDMAVKAGRTDDAFVIVGYGAVMGQLVSEIRGAGIQAPIVLSAESVLPPNPEVISAFGDVHTVAFEELPPSVSSALASRLSRPVGAIDVFTYSAVALIWESYLLSRDAEDSSAANMLKFMQDPRVAAKIPSLKAVVDQRLQFAAKIAPYSAAVE